MVRASNVWCEEVILVNTRRGAGNDEDPVRVVLQVYSKDGILLAENDPVADYSITVSSGEDIIVAD